MPKNKPAPHWPPLLIDVERARELVALSRAKLYRLMAAGELEFRKIGKRRFIVYESLRDLGTGKRTSP